MVKPNRSYKPKSWVSGVRIQLGGNSDGYPSGGIPVRMSKKIAKKRKNKNT